MLFYSDRYPNFKIDLQIGKIGENDFKIHSNLKLIDLTENLKFKDADIDFIEKDKLKEVDINFYLKQKITIPFSYEIKTDTVGYKSRNLFFETHCFNSIGCAERTLSQWIYYIFIEKNKHGIFEIKERWLINTNKWKKWISLNKNDIKRIKKPKLTKTMVNGLDGWLCNVDYMFLDGVAKKVILNKKGLLETSNQ